jgi:hypothetical protein
MKISPGELWRWATDEGVNLADLNNFFDKSEIHGEILDEIYLSRFDKFKPNLPISRWEKSQKSSERWTGISPDTIDKFRIHWYPSRARYFLIIFRYSKFTKMRLTPAEPEPTETCHSISISFWNSFGKCVWTGLYILFSMPAKMILEVLPKSEYSPVSLMYVSKLKRSR